MAKAENLLGRRFSKLVVIEEEGASESGYRQWLCQCDCGNKIVVESRRLKRGTITSCGCIPKNNEKKGQIAEDITGKRFGFLTAIERVENRNGRTFWLCECDCGRKKEVSTKELKRGTTRSCGCGLVKRDHAKRNLQGMRFGKLLVEKATTQRDKKGNIIWECQCDCGNKALVSENNIMQGYTTSCGCKKEENNKKIHSRLTFVDSTCIELLEYRKSRSDNTSGFRGVYKTKTGKWSVQIGLQNRRYRIGTYSTFEEAVKARVCIEEELHSRFVNEYRLWLALKETQDVSSQFYFNVIKNKGDIEIETPFISKKIELP